MYSVTDAFNAACAAPGRELTSKILFNGTKELASSEVQEISITEQFGSSDGATIGAAFSSQCKVVIYKQTPALQLSGGNFTPSVGIMVGGEAQYVQKGKYYIPSDGVEDSGKLWVTVTGYDRMAGLTEDYMPTITFPATPAQMLADVCKQASVTPPAVTMPSIQIAAPYTGTLRQQLGWLAGLIGCNAKFDATGNLAFCWYADGGLTVGRDTQYMDGLTLTTDDAFTIHSLLTGTDSNPISVGAGKGITTINPYMTAEVAETVFAEINGKTMRPCTVKWRGNPAVEAGDIVSVIGSSGENLTAYVMELKTQIKGGMSADLTCYGPSDTDYAALSPSEQKFKRMYDDVVKSFQDATQKIIGAQGGYFEITYNKDGYPTGWTLRNTPTVEDNTKMWIMSVGGLGFSADGGKTISKVALTMDGTINGAALAIGSVSQDAVSGLSQKLIAIDGKFESTISKTEAQKTYATKTDLENIELTPGPPGPAGADGKDGTNGTNGLSVWITYHDNTTTPATPTGNGTLNGWHTDLTASVVWMSQKVAASATDGTWGAPIRILGETGATGAQGKPGKDGTDGKDGTNGKDGTDGVSVTDTAVEYYLSTSDTELSGGTWSDAAPEITDGTYLWSRTKITYSDGDVAYTGAYCISKAMADSAKPLVSETRTAVTELSQEVDKFKVDVAETYTEKSEFSTFRQSTEANIEVNSEAITQQYSDIKSVEETVKGIDGQVKDVTAKVTATEGYIKTGKIAEDENQNPLYGVEVGQTGADQQFFAFARFLANKIAFLDAFGHELSYFSGQKYYISDAVILNNLNLGGYEMSTKKGITIRWAGR